MTAISPLSSLNLLNSLLVAWQGRGIVKMAEHDALVLNYSHLMHFPRQSEALHILKKVASLVKPIMRARQWRVNELAEFFPDQPNLLGMTARPLVLVYTIGTLTCARFKH